jgi:hypothetical protein
VLRDDLTRKDILILRRKINMFRDEGKGKLNFVFDRFLPAKRGKAKAIVLRYLKLDKKPVYPVTKE